MATKASIITEINQKIVANGNIRATVTNKILKDILNCTELNTNNAQSTIEALEYNAVVDIGIAVISYSIKGFIGLFANITLGIVIKEGNSKSFNVPIDEGNKLISFLNTIIVKNNKIDFLIKINSKSNKNFRIGNLNFRFNNNSLLISIESQSPNDKIEMGDYINTSFTMHTP